MEGPSKILNTFEQSVLDFQNANGLNNNELGNLMGYGDGTTVGIITNPDRKKNYSPKRAKAWFNKLIDQVDKGYIVVEEWKSRPGGVTHQVLPSDLPPAPQMIPDANPPVEKPVSMPAVGKVFGQPPPPLQMPMMGVLEEAKKREPLSNFIYELLGEIEMPAISLAIEQSGRFKDRHNIRNEVAKMLATNLFDRF